MAAFALVALACFAAIRPAQKIVVIAAEHFVDVGLRDVAAVGLEPRTVQILRAVAPRRGRIFDLFEHAGDVVLDEIERRQNFADALAGKILEIAGLENLDHEILDVLGEAVLAASMARSAAISCMARRSRPRGACASMTCSPRRNARPLFDAEDLAARHYVTDQFPLKDYGLSA